MRVFTEPLRNKKQTVDRIFFLSDAYSGDLDNFFVRFHGQDIPVSSLTLSEYFDFVKNIPYRRDIEPVEVVARPKIIFSNYIQGVGKDCKKAAVLMGAYLNRKKIPWRLVVVSTRPDKELHHIFPQGDVYLNGDFLNLDCTYSYMRPFTVKTVTKAEIYESGTINPLR